MRLFILGATGGIGSALVEQALARGHQVTAFVRSPEKITRRDERLTVVKGDPHSVGQLAAALPDHDAVLSALGRRTRDDSTLLADCARSTIAAMTEAHVGRLLIVSVALLFPESGVLGALLRHTILGSVAHDAEEMERLVAGSSLDWTVVRPPRLTNGLADGRTRVEEGHLPRSGRMVARADVARIMLDAVEQDSHRDAIVGVAR